MQEMAKKEEQAFKRKYKKRSVPLTKAGRKRAWKKRAEGKLERENGKFIKKEEVISEFFCLVSFACFVADCLALKVIREE